MESLPPSIAADAAFFLDFDGTLAAIAERPELVTVEARVLRLLQGLHSRFGGAVAILTGRPLEVVDRFLAPVVLPAAAEHGSVRRDALGRVHVEGLGANAVEAAAARLEPLVAANPGLLLERKTFSVALHYRQRPELAADCAKAAKKAAETSGLLILPGKMVYELRPRGADKGRAVSAFLAEPPFRGRIPVCIGDDVTDEHAFAIVNEAGGVSVKIGEGETVATYRLATREDFLAWAESLLATT